VPIVTIFIKHYFAVAGAKMQHPALFANCYRAAFARLAAGVAVQA
jgi:hypothetical protein